MDRNTVLGLVLIVGLVLTWTVFFAPKNEPKPQNQTTTQIEQPVTPLQSTVEDDANKVTLSKPVTMTDSAFAALSDSEKTALLDQQKFLRFGDFYKLYEGVNDYVKIETELVSVEIPLKGAYMASLYLNKYRTFDSLPLPVVMENPQNYFSLVLGHRKATTGFVKTKDLYFKLVSGEKEVKVTGEEEKEVILRAALDENRYLDFIYKFKGNSYDWDFDIRLKGLGDVVTRGKYDIEWKGEIPKTELSMELMRQKTALYYHYQDDDVDNLNPASATQAVDVPTPLDWVSFRSQFFFQALVAGKENAFKDSKLSHDNPAAAAESNTIGDTVVVKEMKAQLVVPYIGNDDEIQHFEWLSGPLDYSMLKAYNRDFQYQIQLGWGPLKYINVWLVIPVFKFLEGFIGNYGLIILILALLIKIILYPLTFRTFKSTAKMRVINQTPEIKELEAKYKDNATKLQSEKMAIYRKMGVSPFGGCLPMLLQYPFLISLFFLFPNAIELRQESFLWANDLSTYDSILDLGFKIPMYGDHVSLWTLLMTISIYVYTWINQQTQATVQQGFMKWMPYIFPVLFLGFLNNYSAGLSYYYFLSNIISIAQTQLSKRFVDDEAILAQMRESGKKKGNGGGSSRLGKWMENQQKKQAEMRKIQPKGGKSK